MNCGAICSIAAFALLSGCGRSELSGPPIVRLGRDECVACGMIISEDRCSGALLVEREGEHEYRLFDDLGCLLDYERENASRLRVVETFVHDHDTGAWITPGSAVFLVRAGDSVRTPMGSGLVAFSTRKGAEAEHNRSGGELMEYSKLASARREWMDKRLGKQEAPR